MNVLELLPEKLLDEVLDDARAALEDAGMVQLYKACELALATLQGIGDLTEPTTGQKWRDTGPVWQALIELEAALNGERRP